MKTKHLVLSAKLLVILVVSALLLWFGAVHTPSIGENSRVLPIMTALAAMTFVFTGLFTFSKGTGDELF
jgi:hypothetical protein